MGVDVGALEFLESFLFAIDFGRQSLDALLQRFGRLNRGGREIAARAVIVLPGDQDLPPDKLDEAAPCDSIYDNAIPRTWRWLSGLAQDGVVDFGINAMTAAVDGLRAGWLLRVRPADGLKVNGR